MAKGIGPAGERPGDAGRATGRPWMREGVCDRRAHDRAAARLSGLGHVFLLSGVALFGWGRALTAGDVLCLSVQADLG